MAKMINVDELIEFCNTERAMLHARGNSVTCAALRRVVEFAKEYVVEAEPVKQDTELSIILQDYGIKDTDTLRYILDQYQKVIVEITHGRLSKLTYPADTIVNMEKDVSREYWEKELVKHGRWIENSDPGQNINEHYMCSECGCTFHNWANDNYCPNCGSKQDL